MLLNTCFICGCGANGKDFESGPMAHFLYVDNLHRRHPRVLGKCKKLKNSIALVTELIEPTVASLGLELWGIEHIQQGKYSLLRIYIESDKGITIENCEQVSKQVSALLDVEDPISGEYTLEVSSPGVERPLFTLKQFAQYVGSEVKLRMHNPVSGRRNFKGEIVKVEGDIICLSVDGTDFELSFSEVEKTNIVF